MDPILYWYLYASILLGFVMNSIFYLLSRWPPRPTRVVPASPRHGVIVVTHNSSDKIRVTLAALLRLLEPHQIFIADNGSTPGEEALMDAICEEVSLAYWRAVRVPCLCGGSPRSLGCSHFIGN